jgi:hypothetical protein
MKSLRDISGVQHPVRVTLWKFHAVIEEQVSLQMSVTG